MRSHTVAAEGGSAGVIRGDDSLDNHFDDTVSGGDWLCDQDAVQYFVEHCTEEMIQLEHWGCPWSRHDDGTINVRFFGGMTVQRTWFAADKSGFHMLHTLFQTSIRYAGIERYDEFFVADLIVQDGRVHGVLAIEIATGALFLFECKAVILCTGGAGRVYRQNTNAGIVTGDGMGTGLSSRRRAARHGIRAVSPDSVARHRYPDHRRLPRRGRHPDQQERLPLFAGLRSRSTRPVSARQGNGTRAARPAVPGVLA